MERPRRDLCSGDAAPHRPTGGRVEPRRHRRPARLGTRAASRRPPSATRSTASRCSSRPTSDDVDRLERELCAVPGGILGGTITSFPGLFGEVARAVGLDAPRAADRDPADLARPRGGGRGRPAPPRPLGARARASRRRSRRCSASCRRPGSTRRRFGAAIAAAEAGAYEREIRALFAAYERLRDALRRDRRAPARRPRDGRPALAARSAWNDRPVFLYGFDDLTREQIELVGALAGAAAVTVTVTFEDRQALAARAELLGVLRDELGADGDASGRAGDEPDRPLLHHLERNLFEPDSGRIEPDGSLRLLEGAGERGEAELIGRKIARLLADGADPDEIAIAVRSPDRQAPLIARTLGSDGHPARAGGEHPARRDGDRGEPARAARDRRRRRDRPRPSSPSCAARPAPSPAAVDWLERARPARADARRRRRRSRAGRATSRSRAGSGRSTTSPPPATTRPRSPACSPAPPPTSPSASTPARVSSPPAARRSSSAPPARSTGRSSEVVALGASAPRTLAGFAELLAHVRVPLWRGPTEGRVRILSPYRLRATRVSHLFVAGLADGSFPAAARRRSAALRRAPAGARPARLGPTPPPRSATSSTRAWRSRSAACTCPTRRATRPAARRRGARSSTRSATSSTRRRRPTPATTRSRPDLVERAVARRLRPRAGGRERAARSRPGAGRARCRRAIAGVRGPRAPRRCRRARRWPRSSAAIERLAAAREPGPLRDPDGARRARRPRPVRRLDARGVPRLLVPLVRQPRAAPAAGSSPTPSALESGRHRPRGARAPVPRTAGRRGAGRRRDGLRRAGSRERGELVREVAAERGWDLDSAPASISLARLDAVLERYLRRDAATGGPMMPDPDLLEARFGDGPDDGFAPGRPRRPSASTGAIDRIDVADGRAPDPRLQAQREGDRRRRSSRRRAGCSCRSTCWPPADSGSSRSAALYSPLAATKDDRPRGLLDKEHRDALIPGETRRARRHRLRRGRGRSRRCSTTALAEATAASSRDIRAGRIARNPRDGKCPTWCTLAPGLPGRARHPGARRRGRGGGAVRERRTSSSASTPRPPSPPEDPDAAPTGAPARRRTRRPTAEQAAAIGNRDRDVFLEAGAGTGKTRVLVERYCEAVDDDGDRAGADPRLHLHREGRRGDAPAGPGRADAPGGGGRPTPASARGCRRRRGPARRRRSRRSTASAAGCSPRIRSRPGSIPRFRVLDADEASRTRPVVPSTRRSPSSPASDEAVALTAAGYRNRLGVD